MLSVLRIREVLCKKRAKTQIKQLRCASLATFSSFTLIYTLIGLTRLVKSLFYEMFEYTLFEMKSGWTFQVIIRVFTVHLRNGQ